MPRSKIWKLLIKKFKFSFFFLFWLSFLVSWLSFLIRLNLQANLYHWEYRGKFYYLFGKFSVTEQVVGSKIYVDWPKLLLILFLLYFPFKIALHFVFNFFQKYYQRQAQVYLTKKLLGFAVKNRDLIAQKTSEKVYVLNQIIPEFSRQFFTVPLKIFKALVDLGLGIFSLIFLIRTRSLTETVPLVISFLLVNLIWLSLFYFFIQKTRKLSKQKRWNYREEEKIQIRIFCENLSYREGSKENFKKIPSPHQPSNLGKVYNLLDKNSSKVSSSLLFSEFTELPDLIIPGIAVLFLFLYYHVWLEGAGGLDWNEYFVAYNLQRILSGVKRVLYWFSQLPDFRENYDQIEGFFG